MKKLLTILFFVISLASFGQVITPVNVGATPNSGTADKPRDAYIKINANEAAIKETIDSVISGVEAEEAARIAADEVLDTRIDSVVTAIDDFPNDSIITYTAVYNTSLTPDGWVVGGIFWEDYEKFGKVIKLRFDAPYTDVQSDNPWIKLLFAVEAGGNNVFNAIGVWPEDIDITKTYVLANEFEPGGDIIAEIKEGDVVTPNILRFSNETGRFDVFQTRDTSSIYSINGRIRFYDGRTNPDSDFMLNDGINLPSVPGVSQNGQSVRWDNGDAEWEYFTPAIVEDNITNGATTTAPSENAVFDALSLKQDVITGLTSSGAELNILDGATLSTTEINYVDGVTSAIQTQFTGKLNAASTASTGTDVAFDVPRTYGYTADATGNITFTTTGLVEGITQLMIHNDSSEPTFESGMVVISGTYVINEDNYIMFHAVKSSLILVTISQEQ